MSSASDSGRSAASGAGHASSLKQRAVEELKRFWAIAIYLVVMFGAFTTYRRLVLSQSGVSYLHYGFAVVEALILAKVILLGQALGLARRFEAPPLIRTVLFKSVVFGLFFCMFNVLEHVVEGAVHHEGWGDIARSLLNAGSKEILARTIMITVTFIPFFSFLEADRVMGEGKLFALFFRRTHTSPGSTP